MIWEGIPIHMKKMNGFTLVELMTALVLAGILMTIAIPSFTSVIRANRLLTQTNDFVTTLNFARSEAVKRGINVIICRSADGATCAGSGGWEQGWLIFVDNDNSTTLDAGELLRVFGPLAAGNTLTPNNNFVNRITVQPTGYTTNMGTFVLCADQTGDKDTNDAEDFAHGRAIVVSMTGRVRTSDTSTSGFTDCVTP